MATAAVKQVPIQDFVTRLRKFPEATFDETEQLRKFLQDNPLNPDSLAPYLTWDRQHYTRNLIDKNPLYELIAVCWEIGQISSVHNHRDQNCWMAVPIGRLLVENFHVVHQDLEQGKSTIKSTETVEMNVSQ
ncbi:MAG: cysteine dioxygenase family protein, partial [Candidatus Sulfotelmatobacter sp.]